MTRVNAEVSCVLDCHDKLGEGIFWCPIERALYWVDVPMPSFLHRWDPETGKHDKWPMPEMITSLAKRRDGTLLVASHHGLNVFDPRDAKLMRIAAPEADRPGNRANDGGVDGKGACLDLFQKMAEFVGVHEVQLYRQPRRCGHGMRSVRREWRRWRSRSRQGRRSPSSAPRCQVAATRLATSRDRSGGSGASWRCRRVRGIS